MPRDPLSNFILPALICNAGDHSGGFDPVFLDLLFHPPGKEENDPADDEHACP